ncbi:membrane protein [Anopheles sinensis]|uniref:Membrane protein n=1 Tax=Anopheles sinensis TaxID=74873 RepID=A0A084WHH0_ANOSI|nr:membrane protein [Anopheles sinensis]
MDENGTGAHLTSKNAAAQLPGCQKLTPKNENGTQQHDQKRHPPDAGVRGRSHPFLDALPPSIVCGSAGTKARNRINSILHRTTACLGGWPRRRDGTHPQAEAGMRKEMLLHFSSTRTLQLSTVVRTKKLVKYEPNGAEDGGEGLFV